MNKILLLISLILIFSSVKANEQPNCGEESLALYVEYKNSLHNNKPTLKFHYLNSVRNNSLKNGASIVEAENEVRRYFSSIDQYQLLVKEVKGIYYICEEEGTRTYLQINKVEELNSDMLFFGKTNNNTLAALIFEKSEIIKKTEDLVAKYKHISLSPTMSWK